MKKTPFAKTTPFALTVVLACAAAACAVPQASAPSSSASPAPAEPVAAAEPLPQAPAAPPAPAFVKTETPRNYETIHIKVTGMTCPIRCPREVRDQLMAVPGVLFVTVDTDDREAIVDIVPGTNPELVLGGLHKPYAGRLM